MPSKKNCPVCNTLMPAFPQWPQIVCEDCFGKIESADGRPLNFYDASPSGGWYAEYADTKEFYPSNSCYINGVECFAVETMSNVIVVVPHEDNLKWRQYAEPPAALPGAAKMIQDSVAQKNTEDPPETQENTKSTSAFRLLSFGFLLMILLKVLFVD